MIGLLNFVLTHKSLNLSIAAKLTWRLVFLRKAVDEFKVTVELWFHFYAGNGTFYRKKRIIGILVKKVIFYLKIRSVKNSENVEKLA